MAAAPVFYLIPGLGADERVFQFLRLHGEVQVLRPGQAAVPAVAFSALP